MGPRMNKYTPNDQQLAMLDNWHYHATIGDQEDRYKLINEMTKATASVVLSNTPPSREQSLAITKLQEARMWANAAIACNEKPE